MSEPRLHVPDRGAVVVEDADEILGERHGLADSDADRRTRHRSRRRDPDITEIRFLARAGGDFGHMQTWLAHGHPNILFDTGGDGQGEIDARDLEAAAVIADVFIAPAARGGGIAGLDRGEDAALGDCDA